jgi:PAS domain S-box-containing protein
MLVLVVDDEPDIRRIVRHSLEREQIQVVEAGAVTDALEVAGRQPVDLAVLDLRLPDGSGLELMARLRERLPDLPVILLTAAGSEGDRVLGLLSGADDYVVKPFSARELAARVQVVARRRSPARAAVIEVASLRIDPASRTATGAGEPLDLTRREFDLLLHLASHPNRTFTRAELLEAVWSSSSAWQSEATVTEHVRRLRHHIELDPAQPLLVTTVRGVGYRFAAHDVRFVERAATTSTDALAEGDTDRGITVVISNEHIVHASDDALALVGSRSPAEVVGHSLFDFVAPRSVGATVVRQQVNRTGQWARPEVITIQTLDGRDVLVELTSTPVIWEGLRASQVTLWEVTGDTTKVQELVTGIRTEVAEAVIVSDTQLRILSFNAAAEELYGWEEAEVLGRPVMEVLPWLRDDPTAEATRETFQREGHWQGETVQRRRDGSSVTVLSTATLLRDSAGAPVGVISVNRPSHAAHHGRSASGSGAHLEPEIRRGIEQGEFVLHYQPVVRLDDGLWQGAEALVRWQHPDLGLLPPSEFIDAAERSGAIVELGQVVLDEASAQWARWRDAGHDLHVAVNLSGRQIADPNVVDRIAGVMDASSMPDGALRLEVTETSLVEDLDQATKVLARLTELGAHISIDDFGTGWASLTYLREFPVHSLKIDRVFVAGLGTSATDAAICSSIISLGDELDLQVVAEGIETVEQADHLRSIGCRFGQGYLFTRPQPADALEVPRRR